MGNRAHVIFTNKDGENISPAVYFHWNGGPESIYAFLAELDRREVRADQEYEVARFIGIASEFFDNEYYGAHSLGVRNGPATLTPADLEPFDHGDNGIYVVCREDGLKVRRFTSAGVKRGLKEWKQKDVDSERKEALAHDYAKPDGIPSVFADKQTEAEHSKQRYASLATA